MTGSMELQRVLEELEARPASVISHHGAPCCQIAEGWFRAMARSLAGSDIEPRWVSERWAWGPRRWPLSWCEAVHLAELDCGALAHLAEVAFRETGRVVVRAQLVEAHSGEQCAQWAARWQAVPEAPRWIWEGLVYHEAVGVPSGTDLWLWDPTDGRWRDPADESGRIRAICLASAEAAPEPPHRRWGDVVLPPGRWIRLP